MATAYAVATIDLDVNGETHRVEVRHHWTLLHVLREVLGLTGAKRGCDRGECGACTVLVDELPVYACQVLALQVEGRRVRTVEGLARDGELDRIQRAFLENDGGQCGFCTPGFLMSSVSLLERNPSPSEPEIRQALAGNICRCNAYGRIIASVKDAAIRSQVPGLRNS